MKIGNRACLGWLNIINNLPLKSTCSALNNSPAHLSLSKASDEAETELAMQAQIPTMIEQVAE